jgi:hypothetical protein
MSVHSYGTLRQGNAVSPSSAQKLVSHSPLTHSARRKGNKLKLKLKLGANSERCSMFPVSERLNLFIQGC